jgi:hypothetical protein
VLHIVKIVHFKKYQRIVHLLIQIMKSNIHKIIFPI